MEGRTKCKCRTRPAPIQLADRPRRCNLGLSSSFPKLLLISRGEHSLKAPQYVEGEILVPCLSRAKSLQFAPLLAASLSISEDEMRVAASSTMINLAKTRVVVRAGGLDRAGHSSRKCQLPPRRSTPWR
jgi:hypothetical protein